MNEIFHEGEKMIQKMTGEELSAEVNGGIISNAIAHRAVNFIEKQPMVIVSSSSNDDKIWASLLIGDIGFVKVINESEIQINLEMVWSDSKDILYENIQTSFHIGLLFIEMATRKRFRINGVCTLLNNNITIKIDQAFPNCPQYIQRRIISLSEHFKETNSLHQVGNKLNNYEMKFIQSADTLFVGSISTEGNMDVSHRGGNPGFVQIRSDGNLQIPDYRGNSMFNTLGNFVQNPKGGLLFIDFIKKETLQLYGEVELLFDQNSEEDLQRTNGTGRYWIFKPQNWIYTQKHHDVNWDFIDYYPYNP